MAVTSGSSECAILLPEITQTSSLRTAPYSRQRKRNLRSLPTGIPYRHIPSSAASDFARTATPEPTTKEQSSKSYHPIVEELDPVSPLEEQVNQIPLNTKQSRLPNDTIEVGGGKKEVSLRRRAIQKPTHQRSECPLHGDECFPESEDDDCIHEASKQTRVCQRSVTWPNPLDRPDWTEQDECADVEASIISAKVLFSSSGPKTSTSDLVGAGKPASVIRQEDNLDGKDREQGLKEDEKKPYSWNCIHFLRR